MWRWALSLFLLLPGSIRARADEKPKQDDAPAVWPPPADEDAPKKKPAAAKKDSKDKPADPPSDEPLPRLMDEEDDVPPPPPPKPEPPEDRCQAPQDECHENCTIEHSNDDTTKPNGRQGLVTCISRCNKAHAACEERRALGLEEKRRDSTAP